MRRKGRKRPESEGKASGALQGAASAFASQARRAYLMIPDSPIIDRQTVAILLFSVALYALFIAYFFVFTPQIKIESQSLEGPLSKNSNLMVLPGETYVYRIPIQGEFQYVRYSARGDPSCSGTYIEEEYAGETGAFCLEEDGEQAQGWQQGGNRSLLMFSPWMLALEDDFNWSVQTMTSALGMQASNTIEFFVAGKKMIGGREAYEVKLASAGEGVAGNFSIYVDSEKRVLLLTELGGSSVALVSAPFPLDWENLTAASGS